MTVAVVGCTYEEADILDLWIQHLLAEGIEFILIADKLATDETREILEAWSPQVAWIDDSEPYYRNVYWIDRLAEQAHDRGADFILPCDPDEFVHSIDGQTVAERLNAFDGNKVYMEVWPHRDWTHRFMSPHRLPKVAYRWAPNAHIALGHHEVSIPGGDRQILGIRELQYRGLDHFCRKITKLNITIEPSAKERGDGWHHVHLENAEKAQLQDAWMQIQAQAVVLDPIPTHLSLASLSHSLVQSSS